ncbi:hypothetical protein [Kitasatospora sp. NPDC059673]
MTARAAVSVRGARACEAARIELYGGKRKGAVRREAKKVVAK